ncbi:DMT family transporter [soil metagenome]
MRSTDIAQLISLAAVWGGSFLFMRMGAAEFGPIALVAVRVIGAALMLMPMLVLRGQWPVLRAHWRHVFVVGLTNSAVPFLCYAYAALSITAGLLAIFNAAAPLIGALIAWLWLKDRLTPMRVLGLLIGFAGVLWLAWDKASFKAGGSGWAVVACLIGTLFYGLSAALAKRWLMGVTPLAVAAGSQFSAALVLLVPAFIWWPASNPSAHAWLAAALLAVVCTGFAYILFFKLNASIGPSNAITVTFLVPVFAMAWGWMFLAERVTPVMALGCGVILLGTSLSTGLLKWPVRVTATG